MNKPRQLDPLAVRILESLQAFPESSEIVLGGYFALKHYLDYRQTHDIDAWWRTRRLAATERIIDGVMRQVASETDLQVAARSFGDTVSFELLKGKARVFSFQIATRSIELEAPLPSPWPPIHIESLNENIGAKMNAVVERGAPRDFIDIRKLNEAGLVTVEQCWQLWQAKNPGMPVVAARDKVRLHLAALKARRPLDSIADPLERANAMQNREWLAHQFLR